MGGKPQKPKIQAYVEQQWFDEFETYCSTHNLNQSKAIEKILAEFFGGPSNPTLPSDEATAVTTFALIDSLRAELAELRNELDQRLLLVESRLGNKSAFESAAPLKRLATELATNHAEPAMVKRTVRVEQLTSTDPVIYRVVHKSATESVDESVIALKRLATESVDKSAILTDELATDSAMNHAELAVTLNESAMAPNGLASESAVGLDELATESVKHLTESVKELDRLADESVVGLKRLATDSAETIELATNQVSSSTESVDELASESATETDTFSTLLDAEIAEGESVIASNSEDIPELATPANEPVGGSAASQEQNLIPLTSVELGERLGTDNSTISRNKSKGSEHFRKWSAEHDPAGIAWEHRPGKHKTPQFHPLA